MQRILQPGEIETLEHVHFPRVRLPQPGSLFQERAARLLQLADGSPIADYLRFAAGLAAAQHRQAGQAPVPEPLSEETVRRASVNAMPLLPAGAALPPFWQDTLRTLLADLRNDPAVPDALHAVLERLAIGPDEWLAALAAQAIAGRVADEDLAAAPLVMAALQVRFALCAAAVGERCVPWCDPPTICPVCGSVPVASVLRVGGAAGGHRYLHCGLCATEWHMVRVKCSHCESTQGVRYQGVQGTPSRFGARAVLAETCDQCHLYRKLVNQEMDPLAEPLADDLASLALDLLMADTAFARASGNPLLWIPA